MPRKSKFEPTALTKMTYWLAQSFTHCVRLQTELAAIPEPTRGEVRSGGTKRLLDADIRLALALEGYGELVRTGGDPARAEAILAELEFQFGFTQRSNPIFNYMDPLKARQEDRAMRVQLKRKRKKLEKAREEGASAKEIHELKSEVDFLEHYFDETPYDR